MTNSSTVKSTSPRIERMPSRIPITTLNLCGVHSIQQSTSVVNMAAKSPTSSSFTFSSSLSSSSSSTPPSPITPQAVLGSRMPIRAISSVENPNKQELEAISRINDAVGAVTSITSPFSYRSLCNSLLTISFKIVTPRGAIITPIKSKIEAEGYRIGVCKVDEGILVIPCIAVTPAARRRSTGNEAVDGHITSTNRKNLPVSPAIRVVEEQIKPILATQAFTTPQKQGNNRKRSDSYNTQGSCISTTKKPESSPRPSVTVSVTRLNGEVIESEHAAAIVSEIKLFIDSMKYINFCRIRTELTKERFSIIRPQVSATTPIEMIFNKYDCTFVSCKHDNEYLNFTCVSKSCKSPRGSQTSSPLAVVTLPKASTPISPTASYTSTHISPTTSPTSSTGSVRTAVSSMVESNSSFSSSPDSGPTETPIFFTPPALATASSYTQTTSVSTIYHTPRTISGVTPGTNLEKIIQTSQSPISPSDGLASRAAVWRKNHIKSDEISQIPRLKNSRMEITEKTLLKQKPIINKKKFDYTRSSIPVAIKKTTSVVNLKDVPRRASDQCISLTSNFLPGKKVTITSTIPVNNAAIYKCIPVKNISTTKFPHIIKKVDSITSRCRPSNIKKVAEKAEKPIVKKAIRAPTPPKTKIIITRSSSAIAGAVKKDVEGSFMVEWIHKIGGEKWIKAEMVRGKVTKEMPVVTRKYAQPATNTKRRNSAPGKVPGAGKGKVVSSVATKYERLVLWR